VWENNHLCPDIYKEDGNALWVQNVALKAGVRNVTTGLGKENNRKSSTDVSVVVVNKFFYTWRGLYQGRIAEKIGILVLLFMVPYILVTYTCRMFNSRSN
jgi:hypothetical protein